jgi:hypothetical protein
MMKKSTIIILLIISWIAVSSIAILLICKHIEDKDVSLRREIRDNIKSIFENQSDGRNFITSDYGFFDSQMNGATVRNFKRAKIPAKPVKTDFKNIESISPDAYSRALEDWRESYGDVASLWDLNWGSSDIYHTDDEGWNIIGISCHGTDEAFIHTFVKFPYQVALKRSEWGNYYTVPQAVAEAYDFYVNNPKSGISDRFEKGSHNRIWSKIYDCQNDYYGVYRNDNEHSWYEGNPIPGASSAREGGSIEDGWMHNGYYRVYVARTQETHWGIKKHPWNPDKKERDHLLLWTLTIIAVFFIIPIGIIARKIHINNKRKHETLKAKLLRLCNPSNFVKEYDKDKVDYANKIYQRLVEIDVNDTTSLATVANEAISFLSIPLIEETELKELEDKLNPQNFMRPYDANKIEKANELISMLKHSSLKYEDYLEIVKQTNQLYK